MFFGELINSLMRDKQIYALKRRTYLRYEEIIRTQIEPSLGFEFFFAEVKGLRMIEKISELNCCIILVGFIDLYGSL